MEYKLNIFSLIILVGILGTGLHGGKSEASDFKDWQDAFQVISKNDLSGESLLFSRAVSPLKKCCQSLFFERERSVTFFSPRFFLFIRDVLPSAAANAIFGPININAP